MLDNPEADAVIDEDWRRLSRTTTETTESTGAASAIEPDFRELQPETD